MFMQSPVADMSNRVKNGELTSRQLIECRRQKKLQSTHASQGNHEHKDVEEHRHNESKTATLRRKQRSTLMSLMIASHMFKFIKLKLELTEAKKHQQEHHSRDDNQSKTAASKTMNDVPESASSALRTSNNLHFTNKSLYSLIWDFFGILIQLQI
jgi:hypothetical protein